MTREMDRQSLAIEGGTVAGNFTPLADELAAALTEGRSALVTGPASTSVILNMAASYPGLARTRLFTVRPPLDLFAVLGQVSGDGGQSDIQLERGFEALTNPGPGHDRIALLVEDAHLLPQTTLHYIELVLCAGPHLHVVLAGRAGLMETLALPGFATLRKRFSLHLVVPDADPRPAGLAAAKPSGQEPGAAQPGGKTRGRALMYGAAASALAIAGLVGLALVMPKNPYMDAPATEESGIAPVAGLAAAPALAAGQPVPANPLAEPDARSMPEQPGLAASLIPDSAGDPAPALAADAAAAGPAKPAGPDRVPDAAPEVTAETATPQPSLPDDPRPAATADAGVVVAREPAAAVAPGMPSTPAPAAMAALSEAEMPAPAPASSQMGVPDPGPAATPAAVPKAAPSQMGAPDPSPAAFAAAGPEAAAPVVSAPVVSAPVVSAPVVPSAVPAVIAPAAPAAVAPAAIAPAVITAPVAVPPVAAAGMAGVLPPAVTPAQRAVRPPRVAAAAQPAAPRPQPRPAATRPERVADVPPAPRQDGQHCRDITLRLQLGETASNVDRTFLRNGCQ